MARLVKCWLGKSPCSGTSAVARGDRALGWRGRGAARGGDERAPGNGVGTRVPSCVAEPRGEQGRQERLHHRDDGDERLWARRSRAAVGRWGKNCTLGLALVPVLTMDTQAATEECEVEVWKLRRHLLSVPCHLQRFDRVRVVGHHSENVDGRVSAIETSGYDSRVSIVTGEGKEVQVAMLEVIREFELGDLADVVEERYKGERGTIVHMVQGGGLQIYAASSEEGLLFQDDLELRSLRLRTDEDGGMPSTDGVLNVVAEQVELADADKRSGGWSLTSSVTPKYKAVSLCEYDKKRNVNGMHTGKGKFIGTEVMIVAPHAMKGRWGVVIDERYMRPKDLPGEDGEGKDKTGKNVDGER
ncbi:hypothetical protein B0H19DRAFT_474646 [Mycena capillaripes]|nr:hypothetical protein B0H19DRAFT_474646 [Mycena capillaripes]